MSLSPDEHVTRDRALEICQRQGLKSYIAGAIVKFDRNYSITLEALNGQTADQVALVQVEAEGKDQVLKALSRAASELREKLGESLSSIQKFDAKLEVTTSSLEALKEYALGRAEQDRGQFFSDGVLQASDRERSELRSRVVGTRHSIFQYQSARPGCGMFVQGICSE